MRAEVGLLIFLVVIFPAAPAWCDDESSGYSENIDEDSGGPSMELLEFLGSWETDDGEWVDPELLSDTLMPDQESSDE